MIPINQKTKKPKNQKKIIHRFDINGSFAAPPSPWAFHPIAITSFFEVAGMREMSIPSGHGTRSIHYPKHPLPQPSPLLLSSIPRAYHRKAIEDLYLFC